MENNNETAWTVLCSNNSCCPSVRVRSDGNIELRDDNGQIIMLTTEQWGLMKQAMQKAGK